MLSGNLESLESALTLTKEALDVLQELQTLHNKLDIDGIKEKKEKFLDQNLPATTDPKEFEGEYNALLEEFFGQPLIPDTLSSEVVNVLPGLKSRLNGIIEGLKKEEDVEGKTDAEIRNTLSSNSILIRLLDVKDDLNQTDTPEGLNNWLLDGLDDLQNEVFGSIQDNITQATTSAQSLNDTQKEDVRRVLFVFEEYYKSASSILIKITQLVEKMAQAIAR